MQDLRLSRGWFALRFAFLPIGALTPVMVLAAEPALPPLTPPKLNYAQVCKPKAPPLPLAIDWRTWSGGATAISPERMLSDAMRLAEGDLTVPRNAPLARRMLATLTSARSAVTPEAKRQLALSLLDPQAGPVDPLGAERLLGEAMAAQLTDAATTLGRLILDGRLPGRKPADAVKPLSVAAGFGEPAAALELAAAYAEGTLPAASPAVARRYATLAAIGVQTRLAAGDCTVAGDVGRYLLSAGPEADRRLALDWFAIAADAGDTSAMMRLARAYDTGEGRNRDAVAARRMWDKAVAAGRIDALAEAARVRLAAGRETDTALKWLEQGMAAGDADAFLAAARYYRGDYTGKADLVKMQAVLARAETLSDASPSLLAILAESLRRGQGTAPDPERAGAVLKRLLAMGTPEAEWLYGVALARQAAAPEEAEAHLRKALDDGQQEARVALADLLACRADRMAESDRLTDEAAGRGDPVALRRLARLATDRGDRQAATAFWKRGAEAGDRQAMVELAAALFEAQGSAAEIRRLTEAAAAPGLDVGEGRLALARALAAGRLGPDAGRSRALLDSLSESAMPAADTEIARLALFDVATDAAGRQAAVVRLTAAAEAGDADAMLLLAREGQTNGDPQASRWLAEAAARGEAAALADLPDDRAVIASVLERLRRDPSCQMDVRYQQARLYRLSGDAVSADAMLAEAETLAARRPRDFYTLAQRLLGAPQATPADIARAERLLRLSDEAGYIRAAPTLATLLDSGRLGDRKVDAIAFYRKAAAAGDAGAVNALQRLASMPAASGASVAAATDALKALAEADVAPAMRAYGLLLAGRSGESRKTGVDFLRRAAHQGDIGAMKTLARLYATGIGGEVSAQESTKWTRMAAEKGDAEAMYRYAVALDLGFGVEPDPQVAKSWHGKAVQNGYSR